MNKKKILAQLFAESLEAYRNYDAIEDAVWMIAEGVGDTEERWEKFEKTFEEVFGVSFEDAKNLDQF